MRKEDITKRKQVEERRAIRNVNQLITREKDRDRLLQGACEALVETRGYYNAWIALLDEAGGPVMTAEAGLGELFLPMAERLEQGELTACGRRALAQSGVVVTPDPPSVCADCPLSPHYAGRGAMTVRLERGGKVYGLLSVSISRDLAADEEEQVLFEDVAGDIAFALRSIELEKEHKRAEEALRESHRRLEETLVELRATQEKVIQQERLAAVGQLAAGIAHEFNNALTTIVLGTQISLRTPGLSPPIRKQLESIAQESRRATDLVQQILDFGRRAMLRRETLDIAPLLEEVISLLERTLPENIQTKLVYGADEYKINADPARVQQAIVNLALNARDAMPAGGELRIGLERIEIRPGEPPPLPEMAEIENRKSKIKNRAWVRVTVSDTGIGIPPDVLPHIYEPFFTTRAPLGSGLGLAQVYGIVKQHEGYIDVETQVGADCGQSGGTTFVLYWPALPVSEPEPLIREASALAEGGGETILVVEDSASLRAALVDCLEMLNYRVLEAANGPEALAVFEQHEGEISLVLSDWGMPLMGGLELARELERRHPAVKVLMLTGRPLDKGTKAMVPAGVVGWARKPLDLEQLAGVVARVLEL